MRRARGEMPLYNMQAVEIRPVALGKHRETIDAALRPHLRNPLECESLLKAIEYSLGEFRADLALGFDGSSEDKSGSRRRLREIRSAVACLSGLVSLTDDPVEARLLHAGLGTDAFEAAARTGLTWVSQYGRRLDEAAEQALQVLESEKPTRGKPVHRCARYLEKRLSKLWEENTTRKASRHSAAYMELWSLVCARADPGLSGESIVRERQQREASERTRMTRRGSLQRR